MKSIKPGILSEIFHYSSLPHDEITPENEKLVEDCKGTYFGNLEISDLLLDVSAGGQNRGKESDKK